MRNAVYKSGQFNLNPTKAKGSNVKSAYATAMRMENVDCLKMRNISVDSQLDYFRMKSLLLIVCLEV